MKFFIINIILLMSISFSFAQDSNQVIVAVGEAELEKQKIVFYLKESPLKNTKELYSTMINDFLFYKHRFEVHRIDQKNLKWSAGELKKEEASFAVIVNADSLARIQYEVWDINQGKELVKSTAAINPTKKRTSMHFLNDRIYQAITGKSSIFTHEIVYISDRNVKSRNAKELYIMDFDGKNQRRLTYFNQNVLSPSMSPNNNEILYTLIKQVRRRKGKRYLKVKETHLYSYNRTTKRSKLMSNRNGINSGAIFNSSGDKIYLTMSFSGNSEIYELYPRSSKARRVTKHYAQDVDPSINKDGTLMTFLSNRPGSAMIYTMDPRGTEKNVKRISFVGQFNATPRFSPDGKEIVFSSWLDNRFDLFKIHSDGSNLIRLTKNFGSNEEPSFSPDGEFIIFTSQKVLSRSKADQDIYIMNRDGEILGNLTKKAGNSFSPRWSN